MKLINPGAAERYKQWQSEPLTEEDETYDLIDQWNGVKLAEIGVGVYRVDYPDEQGKVHRAVFTSYPAAEACYVHHVSVEAYR